MKQKNIEKCRCINKRKQSSERKKPNFVANQMKSQHANAIISQQEIS